MHRQGTPLHRHQRGWKQRDGSAFSRSGNCVVVVTFLTSHTIFSVDEDDTIFRRSCIISVCEIITDLCFEKWTSRQTVTLHICPSNSSRGYNRVEGHSVEETQG